MLFSVYERALLYGEHIRYPQRRGQIELYNFPAPICFHSFIPLWTHIFVNVKGTNPYLKLETTLVPAINYFSLGE
jgi:hypothetical protein